MSSSLHVIPPDFKLSSPLGIASLFGVFLGLVVLYTIGNVIYNIYFHPLSHIPGPRLAAATRIPYAKRLLNGQMIPWVHSLHEQYGDVVRLTPNDISFISGEKVYPEVYGFRTGKHKTGPYLKDRTWFPIPLNGVYSLIVADEEAHARGRRNLSHAFSDKALREQEGLVQNLVNLLISRLHEQVTEGKPEVDLVRWYNYTTFDIIADLTFGESLHCLQGRNYHPWVLLVFSSAKAIGVLATIRKYPILEKLSKKLIPREAIEKRKEFFSLVQKKVGDRLDSGTDRPDFMSYIVDKKGSAMELSRDEIDSNAALFLIAGSETTATMLSATTYLVLKTPEVYEKMKKEVRERFKSMEEINMEAVNGLEYMKAVHNEGLRYYPPVPTGFPRMVPRGGDTISGHYIPEGTSVYVSQHATNHSSRNFTSPDDFIPDRWLGDERFKDDNKIAFQPFSFGPRNCLGKNLAYAEMRLIMAKILFNFDLELVDKKADWIGKSKLYTLWEKPALMVRLTPVQTPQI